MLLQSIPHDWHGQYPLTDIDKWHLEDKPDGLGNHNWHYLPHQLRPQRPIERYWMGLPYVSVKLSLREDIQQNEIFVKSFF